ncbi:MAG: SUMF1/EgtB/PvdO family nonheme iron enzyme [Planctomycetota bacterium]
MRSANLLALLPVLLVTLLACESSAQEEQRPGRTFVLVVGIDDYADPKIPRLKYAEADAQAVYRFYAQDPGSPTTSDRVKVLLGKQATQRELLRAIEEHLVRHATRPEDTAVLYFAGHGFADAQTTYLAGQDTELDYLGSTAITQDQLQGLWNRLRARTRVLVADACHSGGLGGLRGGPGGFGKRVVKDSAGALRSLVIASAGENELAAEDRRAGRGVFSAALVAGLRGAADRDRDGAVSASELAAYLKDEVPSQAAAVGGKQTPEVVLSPGAGALRLSTPRQSGPRAAGGDERARLEAERKALEAERERAELQKAVAEQKAQASARAQAAAEARLKELEAQSGANADELARARSEAKRLAAEAGQAQAALARAKELEAQRRAAEERAKEEERKRLEAEQRKAEVEQENARLRAELLALKGKQQEAEQARREAEAARARSAALDERKKALESGGSSSSSSAQGGYAGAVAQAKRLAGFRYLDTKSFACGGQRFEIARFRHDATGLVFHLVPGGSFVREGGTRVTIQPFLICASEWTQAAWERVMGTNPSRFKGSNRPVEQVSWNDVAADNAQGFCRKAGLRLPSEAEWEYACRGGTQTAYSFGDSESELGRYAVFDQNWDSGQTAEVGSKLPNAFGLHDMHGNVWEWCQDGYHESYQGAPTDGSPAAGASKRVVRGGGWYDSAWICRSASRNWYVPGDRGRYLGFRPARSLP